MEYYSSWVLSQWCKGCLLAALLVMDLTIILNIYMGMALAMGARPFVN